MPPAHRLRRLALQHWRANRLAPAAHALSAAIAHTPADPALWRDLAGVQQAAGNDAGALQALDRALLLDPANAAAWLARATTAAGAGDHPAAERAFARALRIDPLDPDAHLGLGFLRFEQNRLPDAINSFRAALAHAPAHLPAHALARSCLAHALYAAGEFGAAAAAFDALASLAPLDEAAQRKSAAATFLRTLIEQGPQELDPAEQTPLSGRDAADLLSHFGHTAAALALSRHLLAYDPDDAVLRYQVDVLQGVRLDRSPPDYVERHFDDFAATFEHQLVTQLDYRVPERLTAELARTRDRFGAALDLGCGTGLAAPHLAPLCTTLTGVDLSAGMLDRAAARSLYTDLHKAEAVEFLAAHPGAFDLVFAADLLIYLGDLAPLFAAAAAALSSGGLFAISLEAAGAGTYTLRPGGRFAHALPYVQALADPAFTLVAVASTTLRLEVRQPVAGYLVILQRS